MNWIKKLFGAKDAPPSATSPQSRPSADNKDQTVKLTAERSSDSLPEFPFPLVALAGASAEAEWRKLNSLWRKEGASAVLIGDMKEVSELAEAMKFTEQTAQDLLTSARDQSASVFFEERSKEYGEDNGQVEEGTWPEETVLGVELSAHLEVLSRRPKPKVFIARIPTDKSWEIPAYLKFGGWNDCPAPENQVAVLKYWASKYGLEIYAITGDVMECTVARPPETKEAAMSLAHEHFLFCTDIVHQGTESLSVLGAMLKDSGAWYFWWD
jgi:hypothetical protein